MLFAHGVDHVQIARIERAIISHPRFKEKIYTPTEIAYCESKKDKYASYAVRFAAKEAFLKAIGTGWTRGIAFADVEIDNDPDGRPFITLYQKAKLLFTLKEYSHIRISLSHDEDIALASVILF